MSRAAKPKLILVALFGVALAVAGIATTIAEPALRVFTGHYDWRDGGKDDLTIEFEPDGDGRWKVRFRFEFDGRGNTWKGSAEGALEDGSRVTGTAKWKSRKWTWSATLEDGVMRGTHTELTSRSKTYRTGTFELRRSPPDVGRDPGGRQTDSQNG